MRRRWKWLVLLVLLVVIPVVRVVWNRHEDRSANERTLAETEADLDLTDPGWRLDDLLAERDATIPPDDRNLTKLCWDIYEKRPDSFDQWTRQRGDWSPSPDFNHLPATDKLDAARQVRSEADEVVRMAHATSQRPTGGWKLVVKPNPFDTLLEHMQRVRTVATLLELDAVVAAADQDWPTAIAAVAAGVHVGGSVGDEPLLISQLVRMATDAIAVGGAERMVGLGEPPADQLMALQAALLAEADVPRLVFAFRGERAFYHRMFANLDAGQFAIGQLAGDKGSTGDGFGGWIYRGHLPSDQAFTLNFVTELLAIARRPHHEQIDLYASVELPPKNQSRALSRLILPAFDKVTVAEWRTVARLRSAAVGLACERFRQKAGRWPADLAELRDFLPTIPLDPYDGQPLRYATRDDGVVVYSVGPDRQDDGGTLSYKLPELGEDVGFRLWDVAARRQPAEE